MNFFEQQDIARRNTRVLVLLFAAAVLLLIALTNVAIAGYLWFSQGNIYSGHREGFSEFLTHFSWSQFTTIGLAVAGKFSWDAAGTYILAQLLGGALGAATVWLAYIQHYRETKDQALKLATFCTIPQIRDNASNLFSEVLGTFVLLFAVLFLSGPNFAIGDPSQPVGLGSLGALPVALLVLSIGLSLGGTTGYAINPARDLAPRAMHALLPVSDKGGSNWDYAWIPVVGPVVGGVLAAALYLGIS